MFIGRQKELDDLESCFSSEKFECVIIYGRRRVGKTALISRFIEDKEAIFFTAIESDAKDNLAGLSQSIYDLSHQEGQAPVFSSFQDALDEIYRIAQKQHIVLVIDEYPYIAKADKGFSSRLQAQIDHKFSKTNLSIILCGSSMSFMERQVLGYESPLYGRRTAQMKIQPFSFFEAQGFFEGFGEFDRLALYGVCGGIPLYLSMMDASKTLKENLEHTILNPSSYLFEEPTNLLQQEVRESAMYNTIIKAIAEGSSRHSQIASSAGIKTSAATAYLQNLISLGIVTKELPVVDANKRKTIYSIADNLFRFWYRFLPKTMSLVQNGQADRAYRVIEEQFPAYLGRVFEDICSQYLWLLNARNASPLDFTQLGRWWGTDDIRRCEAEIDIVGTAGKDSLLLAECKWTNERVGASVLETLLQRSELLRHDELQFCLFAKTGFTSECESRATKLSNVTLYSYHDMLVSYREDQP